MGVPLHASARAGFTAGQLASLAGEGVSQPVLASIIMALLHDPEAPWWEGGPETNSPEGGRTPESGVPCANPDVGPSATQPSSSQGSFQCLRDIMRLQLQTESSQPPRNEPESDAIAVEARGAANKDGCGTDTNEGPAHSEGHYRSEGAPPYPCQRGVCISGLSYV